MAEPKPIPDENHDRQARRAPILQVASWRELFDAAGGEVQIVGGEVFYPHGWESRNMVLLRDLPLVGRLYVHRLIAEPLRAALIGCAKLAPYDLDQVGCFAQRAKASDPHQLSLHALGLAVDFNPARNPARRIPEGSHPSPWWDLPATWVDAFEARGFVWGGRWNGYVDPMHFQAVAGPGI